jgi:superfamily I DNA/RNA helicase
MVSSLHEFALELIGAQSTIDLHEQDLLVSQACTQVGSPPASLLKKIRSGQTLEEFTGSEVVNWIKGTAYKSLEIYQSLDFPKGKPQLSSVEREWFFQVFERYEQMKGERCDGQDLLLLAEANIREGAIEPKWSAVLVDEFQDLNLCGLSLIKILSARNSAQLFFMGDHRQRISEPFHLSKTLVLQSLGDLLDLRKIIGTPQRFMQQQRAFMAAREMIRMKMVRMIVTFDSAVPDQKSLFCVVLQQKRWRALGCCSQIQSLIADGVPAGNIALLSLAREQTENILWEIRVRTIELDSSREGQLGYFTEGAVKRATIHGSKGLEFPIVFLVGLSANAFSSHPWVRSEDDPNSAIGSPPLRCDDASARSFVYEFFR